MSDPVWQRVKEVFHQALELDPAERDAFLEQVCQEDEVLRAEIESLIASEDSDSLPWLDRPVYKAAPETLTDVPLPTKVVRSLGTYEIVRKLGQGGMGAVYLAERVDDQYRSQVAIKLVRQDYAIGGVGEEMIRRFRQERQILADLNHPHIARLLDGDTTEDGLPYFIMEYVDGLPIDVYCNRHRLSLSERIELFRKVCAAVQYAHGSLVVHCDLKPSNILVTEDGEPKLLDFGIARLTGDSAKSVPSEEDQSRPLTPKYASPEQIIGDRLTVATDVYSLGVLLYKLLTGHLPFDRSSKPIEQAILEEDPTRPSDAEHLQPPGGSPRRLRKLLQGDLDSIVLMAMRKEPIKRYRSVGQFSEDLRRHQVGFPVVAHKDTWRYRSGKFVRRHRGGVAAAILIALSLIAGIVTTTWMAYEATAAHAKAEGERIRAKEVSMFLERLFRSADPKREERTEDITVKELLDQAAQQIDEELVDQPLVQSDLMSTIGIAYQHHAQYDEAARLLGKALEIRRQTLGAESPLFAESLEDLCSLWREQSDYDRALPLCRQALNLRRQLFDEKSVKDFTQALNRMALLMRDMGRYEEAEDIYNEALTLVRRHLGEDDVQVAVTLHNLGGLLRVRGEFDMAEVHLRDAVELYRNRLGPDHPYVASGLNTLAALLKDKGDYEQSESTYREALSIREKIDPKHPDVATTLNNLAALLYIQDRYEDAEDLFIKALNLFRENQMGERREVVVILNHLGALRRATGDIEQAEANYREALELGRRRFGKEHPSVTVSLLGLAQILTDHGRPQEAEELLRDALYIRQKAYGENHWRTANAQSHLGGCLTSLGRFKEAERYLKGGLGVLEEQRGIQYRATVETLHRLVTLYETWSKPDEAESYRLRLPN